MKYMLTIQNASQATTYFEFEAETQEKAQTWAREMIAQVKKGNSFKRGRQTIGGKTVHVDGNFPGSKPPHVIRCQYLSKWVNDPDALDGWGRACGGRWTGIIEV